MYVKYKDVGMDCKAESDWRVWCSGPLEVVSADIHYPAPIPKEGLCCDSPCQDGRNTE